ncbi:MAG: YbaB/EbfC family nucleoid-associated protein [Acidimicrobiia bacterium]|nr:YbaB/EbfC family nucleoid-associated protein [Acidimicrobiia bacterium]
MRPQDMRKLMEQAQKMQQELASAQADLAEQTFEGSAGGGVVKATVKGTGEVVRVNIDPSVIDPEDAEMLGDLVTAAVNSALNSVSDAAQSQMGGLTGGLDLGGLLG